MNEKPTCEHCGHTPTPYDPNVTTDRAIADLALRKAIQVLEYGTKLEDQYRALDRRFGERVAHQDKRITELNEMIQMIVELLPQTNQGEQ